MIITIISIILIVMALAFLYKYLRSNGVCVNIPLEIINIPISSESLKWDFSDTFERVGLPLIALRINGTYQYFLVDSGASINMLKQSFYDSLDVKPKLIENKDSIYTGSDSIKSEYCHFDVAHDNVEFKDEKFNIAQLNVFAANRDAYKVDIVGIVGSSMMEKYKWSIDYDKMIITIPNGTV